MSGGEKRSSGFSPLRVHAKLLFHGIATRTLITYTNSRVPTIYHIFGTATHVQFHRNIRGDLPILGCILFCLGTSSKTRRDGTLPGDSP